MIALVALLARTRIHGVRFLLWLYPRMINERGGSEGRDRWMGGLARRIGLSDCLAEDEKREGGSHCWWRMWVKKKKRSFVKSEV